MSVLVIGVNHHTGPVSVLERVAIPADEVAKAVTALTSRDNVREAVVLSTCNRTEVYAIAERFHGAYADIRDFLCDVGSLAPDELHPHLYSEHDDAAIRHLFEVAAGLDSAVVGEAEILGQLRQAWEVAQREGGARAGLNLLFRHAVGVGKRARTETAIARGTASVSHAAVEMANDVHGSIAGRRVAVVGAGSVGEGIAVALHGGGAGEIIVVNRSAERGSALAERVGGHAIGIERLDEVLRTADVVLTSTGAGTPIIDRARLERLDRAVRPLLIVDVAVPRDVDPDATAVPGVTVLDIDDLARWAERGRAARLGEVDQVRTIVADEVDRFAVESASVRSAPLVTALRRRAEEVRLTELERHGRRLDRLEPAERELVESITRSLIAKLLHEPSVRLRAQAGSPQGERNAAAIADLFDLD